MSEPALRSQPTFSTALLHAWLVCAALGVLPLAAWSKCEVKAFEIPVRLSGLRAIATVRINGAETPMTVDSGATFSILTEAAAQQLNLDTRAAPRNFRSEGLAGAVEMRVTKVKQLGFLSAEISNVEFLVGGNDPGAGTMGLLGRNLLGSMDTEYDIAHGAVRLMKPSSDCEKAGMAYWAGSTPVVEVPLVTDRGEVVPQIRAIVQINGKRVTAMFDTGAQSLLSLKAARSLGIITDEAKLTAAGTVYGIGHGVIKSWTMPIDSFELGGERITNSRLRVADFDKDDFDMLIGIDYFLSHRIYVARSQERMYFTYAGGPVFDLSIRTDQAAAPETEAPRNAAGFAHRGALRMTRDDHAGALDDFDHAIALDPSVADYYTQRAINRAALAKLPLAIADLGRALELDPKQASARLLRAQMQLAMKARAAALDDLATLTREIPAQSHMRIAIANIYMQIALPGLAIPQFSAWIEFHANDIEMPSALNSRCYARALVKTDLQQAIGDCDAALKASPDNSAYLDSRALAYLRLGDLQRALKDYDSALKAKPAQAWSLYGRGLVQQQLGKPELADADIAAARKLMPTIDAEAQQYGFAAR